MKSVYERLKENFERWEIRGRGVLRFERPVWPAPPFAPFPGHRLKELSSGRDSARHTIASGLFAKLTSLIRGEAVAEASQARPDDNEEEDIEPDWLEEDSRLVELQVRLPEGMRSSREAMAQMFTGLTPPQHPLVFEIVGTDRQAWVQWAADVGDADILKRQMRAHFPDARMSDSPQALADIWPGVDEAATAMVEFALGHWFMWPLAAVKHDPFVTLGGALTQLQSGEFALYQVIFTPLSEPWLAATMDALTKDGATPFFEEGAELAKAARHKLAGPLFGVVVRLAAAGGDDDSAWRIVRRMAAALRHFSNSAGNDLVPLHNDGYGLGEHVDDLLQRRSRRPGMLLSLDELTGFVHLPSEAVQSPDFARLDGGTRQAPNCKPEDEAVCLGINQHEGREARVWLSKEQRLRHCHIIGGTGTGKSTLLYSMIRQDIESGQGVALLDPHGDLVDKVLGIIPPERVCDVVLLDPADERFVVPFNILAARSDFEKQLLASDLVSVFQRLSTSWGDQMNSVFQNAVLAFLESRRGGTLADMRRFLADAAWRNRFLSTVSDPDVRFYWQHTFPQLGGGRSIGPVLTRLETFLSPKPVRYMVAQNQNRLDFGAMMDEGRIFLAKLSQGQIGRENAFLLGSLIMTKLQQMAMSRARIAAEQRRPFFCYIDEFHHFIAPSLAEVLSGARKYGLGLVLAHQELKQLDRDKEVASAVMANSHTRVVFRVGDADARALAEGFAHFETRDLQSLPDFEALCRVERADRDFNLQVPWPAEVDWAAAQEQRALATAASHAAYSRRRAEVEAELLSQVEAEEKEPEPPKARKPASSSLPPSPQPIVPASPEAVPTTLVSEVVPSQEPAPEVAPEVIPEPPPDPQPSTVLPAPGKGGFQHRIVQERIRTVAVELGFQAMLEMQVGASRESIDVALVRPDLRIACEISVTTTIDHEVGNVRKCLKAGFDVVAVITSSERRLLQIEAAILGCFDPADIAKVRYFQPEDFFSYLAALPQPSPEAPTSPPPEENVRKGWRVKRSFVALTPEERALKEEAAFRLLAKEMQLPQEKEVSENKPTKEY